MHCKVNVGGGLFVQRLTSGFFLVFEFGVAVGNHSLLLSFEFP